MIIGTINFHFAHNFGAVLESVALKEYLEKKGHQVIAIDYRPEYLEQQYAVYPNPFAFARWAAKDYTESPVTYRLYRMSRRFIQAFMYYKDAELRKKRSQLFEAYVKNNMNLTRRYRTIEDLKKEPPTCDVYISGSDQIWNPMVTAGIDEGYFLNFGDFSARKIAYAVSPCQLNVEKYKNKLAPLLMAYEKISLREEQFICDLSEMSNAPIENCIDPTLLLDESDYQKYMVKPEMSFKEYILVYGFDDKLSPKLLNDITSMVSMKTGCKIIDVSMDGRKRIDSAINLEVVSPGEFLYYVKNARFVVTNSFHGTVFSIIYNKKFVSVSKSGTSSRAGELLASLGLNDRMTAISDERTSHALVDDDIDYHEVHKRLMKLRKKSELFFKEVNI